MNLNLMDPKRIGSRRVVIVSSSQPLALLYMRKRRYDCPICSRKVGPEYKRAVRLEPLKLSAREAAVEKSSTIRDLDRWSANAFSNEWPSVQSAFQLGFSRKEQSQKPMISCSVFNE